MMNTTEEPHQRSQSPDSSEFEIIRKEECEKVEDKGEKEAEILKSSAVKEGDDSAETVTLKKEEYDALLLRVSELEIENKKLKKIEEEEAADEDSWGEPIDDPKVAQQFREDWDNALILRGRILQKREDEEERRRKEEEYEEREKYYADRRGYDNSYNDGWNSGRNEYDDQNPSYGRYSPQYYREFRDEVRSCPNYDESNYEFGRSKSNGFQNRHGRSDCYSNSRYADYDDHRPDGFTQYEDSDYYNFQSKKEQYDYDDEW